MIGEPVISLLEANWEDIRDECLQVSGYIDYPESQIYKGKWVKFGIFQLRRMSCATGCPEVNPGRT